MQYLGLGLEGAGIANQDYRQLGAGGTGRLDFIHMG